MKYFTVSMFDTNSNIVTNKIANYRDFKFVFKAGHVVLFYIISKSYDM